MTDLLAQSVAVFSLGDRPFALDVARIEQVVRAVEIAPLPGAPAGVMGVIDVRGRIVPVFDLRVRFAQPSRPVRASDYLVITRTHERTVAVLAEGVLGVMPGNEAVRLNTQNASPEIQGLEGIVTVAGDVVLIHDIDRFLSAEDEQSLTEALAR